MGENCSSNCPTKDHESFGACLRAKGARVAYCSSASNQDYTTQKRWDKSLDRYRAARAEGIQPASTRPDAVERAVRLSDAAGSAWTA